MSPIVSPASGRERFRRPKLRLVRGQGEPRPDGTVLLVGADPSRRAALRVELGGTLSGQTVFAEADAAFEVLEQAPTSRLVVLAGDLEDVCVESLIDMLARRHPLLPVISMDAVPPALSAVQA
jgi:DNA-binding NtrC family response regulator